MASAAQIEAAIAEALVAIESGQLAMVEHVVRGALAAAAEHGDELTSAVATVLAHVLERTGRFGEAEDTRRLALEALERHRGSADFDVAHLRALLADTLRRRGKFEKALDVAIEAARVLDGVADAADPRVLRALAVLAATAAARGNLEMAEAILVVRVVPHCVPGELGLTRFRGHQDYAAYSC